MAYEDGVELKLKANSLIELENDGLRVFHGDSWVHDKRKDVISKHILLTWWLQ